MSKGVNAPAPTTAEVVGGVYNATPPVLVDGQAASLQLDVNGKLVTSGSSGGGNVNLTGINGTAPGITNPLPVELSDGTNPVGTAGNPLSVNVITGGGSNASVGLTGVAAPTSATEIGIVDGTGKLQNVSTTNPVPENQTQVAGTAIATAAAGVQKVGVVGSTGTALDGTTAGVLDENIKNVAGSAVATAAAGIQKVGLTDGTGTAITSTGAALDVNVKTIAATQTVQGNKTNNNAAPGATNVGTLPAIANAATPTWVEGDQVGLSVDLSGALRENMAEWGGTTLQAAATAANDGTGANPVVRNTPRRFGQIVTTAALGSNGVFTGPWIDSNQTGDAVIWATARADQASAANGFSIQETDDTTDANFLFNITASAAANFSSGASVAANTTVAIVGQLRRRFWRILYTNGASAQGTFKITATTSFVLAPVQPASASGGSYGSPNVTVSGLPNTAIQTDAIVGPSQYGNVSVFNFLYGPNGTTNAWFYQRTPIVFKTASIAATSTTTASNPIWTPTAGKKFRLMRFQITAQGLAATATGVVTVSLVDSATGITVGTYDVDVPAVASVVSGVNQISGGWIDIGNGYPSLVANNVLNFGISAAGAGTVGTYRINVCGTEE